MGPLQNGEQTDARPTASLEIPPEDIEKALTRIWQDAVKVDEAADSTAEHKPRLRTRLANLVIVLSPELPTAQESINELITDLCLLFPSRFFVVQLDKQLSDDALKTSVSSRCVMGSSGQHVCSEEIFIKCGNKALEYVTSLLRSLFVPDVSIISLILGDPSGTEPLAQWLQELREICNLLLYDSQLAKNYGREVAMFFSMRQSAEAAAASHLPAVRVRDLQWYRTERFRMLIAEQFDTGRYRELVPAISKIGFASPQGPADPAAILLSGWMIAVLGWKVGSKQADGQVSCASPSGEPASLGFAVEKEGFRVSIVSNGNEFSIEFDEKEMLYETAARVASSEKIVERRLRVPRPSLAEHVVSPIQSSGLNDFFALSVERSLDVARALGAVGGSAAA